MPRPAASVQAEIAALEAELQKYRPAAIGADGSNRAEANREILQKRLDSLYAILDRREYGGFVRGRVVGLGGG
jgi:hypothetical protein